MDLRKGKNEFVNCIIIFFHGEKSRPKRLCISVFSDFF